MYGYRGGCSPGASKGGPRLGQGKCEGVQETVGKIKVLNRGGLVGGKKLTEGDPSRTLYTGAGWNLKNQNMTCRGIEFHNDGTSCS